MKFTETPVSYFNGTANVSVPIYEIKSGNLSYPITLNYNTSGIKVAEEAGIVGLGWNISTNAAIIDPIGNGANFGGPDIAPPSVTGPPSQTLPSLTNIISEGEVFKNSQGVCTAFPQFNFQGTTANYDPNTRILSVDGITAKFVNPNGSAYNNWVCVDGQNIKLIENGGTYIAITPDGTKYIFDDYIQASSIQGGQNYTSTTYLDTIISTTGKKIVFKYANSPSSLQPVIMTRLQSWTRDNVAAQPGLSDAFTYTQLTEKFLSEIDFDNGKVEFNYTGRTDFASQELSSITVWHTTDTSPFKTINFNYDYFSYPEGNYGDFTTDNQTVLTGWNAAPAVASSLATQSYRQQRLRLLSVQVNSDPPYSFTYDSTPMPFKTSWAQDIWGYFNGNTTKSLLPDYNYLPFTGTQVPLSIITDAEQGLVTFADRSAHFNFMKAGILNTITYPTGGYTAFEYEPNTFTNNQGGSNITDAIQTVNAIGNGAQVQEFDIPDLGFMDSNFNDVNPTEITVRLFCGSAGGTGVCDYSTLGQPGGCTGYDYSPGVQPLDAANAGGLWALIQVEDASGNWNTPANFTSTSSYLENIFDWHNTDILPNPNATTGSCTLSNMTKNLPPGHYRIIANYPNTLTNGALGGPFATISVSYKTWSTTVPYNTGPGLRIKTITDYSAGGQVTMKKNITYSGGQLMTQPIFYRYLYNDNHPVFGSPICQASGTLWGATVACLDPTGATCNCFTNVVVPRTVEIVYSDPVIPYSFSANGSLFGYSTVYEQRVDGLGNDQGRTMYSFKCEPDNYMFSGWNLPGTRSAAYLDNGKLIEQQEQKDVSGQYQTLHTTHYDYTIGNPATYWGFKCEYRANTVQCDNTYAGDPIISSSTIGNFTFIFVDTPAEGGGSYGPQNNSAPSAESSVYNLVDGNQFLHFYPIHTGHVNLLDKIETTYDSANPIVTTTTYTYNALNQQSSATTVQSDGKTYVNKTYYTADYTSSSSTDFTSMMYGLNMLDYPIENISTVNGQTVGASYTQYSLHDNMFTPLSTYALNSVTPVALVPSVPANTMDSHYEQRLSYVYNSTGNLVQQQKVGGPLYNYLWDYNNDLPTAAIVNATANDYAYTSFESGSAGNWSYSGTPVQDGTTPSGSYSYLASGGISASNLISTKTYNLSYWTNNSSPYTILGTINGYPVVLRTLNGWTNYMHRITGVSSVSINGTGSVDDLHLYPVNGQMSTYIYDPLIGMTASTDTKGSINYYDYDQDERLIDIKDLHQNIVKAYNYGYAGWNAAGSNNGVFTNNSTISQAFARNNCGTGYVGSQVLYTVNQGTYQSYISQADANAKAQDDLNRNGPDYANANGGCTIAPCIQPTLNITEASGNGSITITTNEVSFQSTTLVLEVYNNSTGNQVGQLILSSLATTVQLNTAPMMLTTGTTYKFVLTANGPLCNTTPVTTIMTL
ncbi:DUF5977 domain-containing protein [Mucilaginibacter frigoritolerans]|nr:DUF5977 domain-containing protein [Mucilaginibacter frigoritolerans]